MSINHNIVIPLLGNYIATRPIFYCNIDNTRQIKVLYDSGSHVPVWTSGLQLFNSLFKDSYKTDLKIRLGGFGGKGNDCDVYLIPTFKICDNLTIKNLYVVLSYGEFIEPDLVLGAGIFEMLSPMVQLYGCRFSLYSVKDCITCNPIVNSEGYLQYVEALECNSCGCENNFIEYMDIRTENSSFKSIKEDMLKYCVDSGLNLEDLTTRVLHTAPEYMFKELSIDEILNQVWPLYKKLL